MCVTVEQDVPIRKRRQSIAVELMSVGGKDVKSVPADVSIFRHNGEVKNHLIYFGVTVASDTKELFFQRVQKAYYFLWRISFREVVSGAVVEDISKQDHFFSFAFFKRPDQLFTPVCRAVDIRGYQQFQFSHSLAAFRSSSQLPFIPLYILQPVVFPNSLTIRI